MTTPNSHGELVHDNDGTPIQGVAEQFGVQPVSTNAAATTGGSDYTYTYINETANHVMIQNNTGANVQWELDVATSAGSPVLATGQTLFLDIEHSTVHLLTAANQNVNGGSGSNIVIRSWL